jgi:hypothetical protein
MTEGSWFDFWQGQKIVSVLQTGFSGYPAF